MSEGWSLVYEGYDPAKVGLRETLCALGNGYFCTRGAAPDALAGDVHYPGTYLAGGYDRLTTQIAGREVENEDLVNLPNWLALTFSVDGGDRVRPDDVEMLEFRQELDLAGGLLLRRLRFRDDAGRTTRWEESRLVSMADPHIGALRVTLTPEDWSGRVVLRSEIDGTVVNSGVARYRDLRGDHLETTGVGEKGVIWLRSRTVQSRLEIAEATRTRLFRDDEPVEGERRVETLADLVAEEFELELRAGEPLRIEKVAAIHCSRDPAISEPALAAQQKATQAPGFDDLSRDHVGAWRRLWDRFDIGFEAGIDEEPNLKLRVHIFHLLQTVSRHSIDRDVGVPPRGWHGEAYRGHIMWDELFIFPFLTMREPLLTRALLLYRHRRLNAARRLAREAGFRGAMYPWQSGSSGREESQEVHLNPESGRWIPDDSHRQRHINSAVAYNVWRYFEATHDSDFLREYGAEMLIEIARFWASVATFNSARDRYEIHGVMGPDEFHTAYPGADPTAEGGLRNNAYTNVTAAWTLNRAWDALDLLSPSEARALKDRLGVEQDELDAWETISRKLFVPFHGDGIISQFEGWDELEEFDWDGYRGKYGDIQRLDRILEAEGDSPNRYKVSKQADVLMLFYLFSSEQLTQIFEQLGYGFDPSAIPRTIDYYVRRTSHGSTLSRVVHSWVLARADRQHSWRLLEGALDSDVKDIQGGTTAEGIHLGAMAGTVDLVQRCYTGLETQAGALHFNPVLSERLRRVTARIRYRRQALDIEVTRDELRLRSRESNAHPVTVAYRGRFREINPGGESVFRLIRPEERRRERAGDGSDRQPPDIPPQEVAP